MDAPYTCQSVGPCSEPRSGSQIKASHAKACGAFSFLSVSHDGRSGATRIRRLTADEVGPENTDRLTMGLHRDGRPRKQRQMGHRRNAAPRSRKMGQVNASLLVCGGSTLYEVQQILGHSDPKVTMRYAHLSATALQGAASKASVIVAPMPLAA